MNSDFFLRDIIVLIFVLANPFQKISGTLPKWKDEKIVIVRFHSSSAARISRQFHDLF